MGGVTAPSMDMRSGFARRTGVIRFERHSPDANGEVIPADRKRDPTQHETDALMTMAIRAAQRVYQPGYQPTAGRLGDVDEFRKLADPLGNWLHELHSANELEGRTIKSLCADFADDEGRSRPLTAGTMKKMVAGLGYEMYNARKATRRYVFVHHPETIPFSHLDEWMLREDARQAAATMSGIG